MLQRLPTNRWPRTDYRASTDPTEDHTLAGNAYRWANEHRAGESSMTDAVQLNPDTLIPMNPAPAPVAATPAAPTPPAPAPAAKTGEAVVEEVEGEGDGQQTPVGGRKPIQPRINELTRARHDAEREAAYWKGVATAKGGTTNASAEAPAPAAPPKPTVDKFQTYDEFVEALTDWKTDRAVEKALANTNKVIEERTTQQTAQQREASLNDNWAQRQEATKKVLIDYDEVVAESDVPIAPHVGELLLESDHGPAIAYKLAKDPSIAEKLNKLSPTAAAKEIGKMEAAFDHDVAASPAAAPAEASSPAPASAAVVKPVSKAPTPPNTLPQSTARTPDLAKMGMDDYVKARKAQGARWGR